MAIVYDCCTRDFLHILTNCDLRKENKKKKRKRVKRERKRKKNVTLVNSQLSR